MISILLAFFAVQFADASGTGACTPGEGVVAADCQCGNGTSDKCYKDSNHTCTVDNSTKAEGTRCVRLVLPGCYAGLKDLGLSRRQKTLHKLTTKCKCLRKAGIFATCQKGQYCYSVTEEPCRDLPRCYDLDSFLGERSSDGKDNARRAEIVVGKRCACHAPDFPPTDAPQCEAGDRCRTNYSVPDGRPECIKAWKETKERWCIGDFAHPKEASKLRALAGPTRFLCNSKESFESCRQELIGSCQAECEVDASCVGYSIPTNRQTNAKASDLEWITYYAAKYGCQICQRGLSLSRRRRTWWSSFMKPEDGRRLKGSSEEFAFLKKTQS